MSTHDDTPSPVQMQEATMPTTPMETLREIAEKMSEEDQPWSRPAEKFRKALRCVEDAKVTPAPDDPGLFEVLSSEGTQTYLAAEGTCTCPGSGQGTKAPWRCYHASAAELYRRWQLALDPAWQPWPSQSESQPRSSSDISDIDPRGENASRAAGEGKNGHVHREAPRHVDLRPVPLPGGGERTTTIGQLMTALARAQTQMRNPGKDALNPHLKTRFASLAETRNVSVPVLAAEGIGLTQWVSVAAAELTCWTLLGHASGEYLILPLPLPFPTTSGSQSPMQLRGSVISYAKRYGLQAAVAVVGDVDDDGEDGRIEGRPGVEKPPVPDLASPTPQDVARDYIPRLEAAIMVSGGDLDTWYKRGEEKFKSVPRSKWGAPQYEYMLRWVKAVQQGKHGATVDETA